MAKINRREWLIAHVKSLAVAIVMVLIIRSSIVEAFKIPSGSMIPTLMVGDQIFVNKFAYGLKFPLWDWLTDHPLYVIKGAPPARGDVIVFKYPRDESVHYIKRVVGIAGDRIQLKDKTVYVNGSPLARSLVSHPDVIESVEGADYDKSSLQLFDEAIPGSKDKHLVMLDRSNDQIANFHEITVPADSLFVMGDNRDFSNDSRFWGFVPLKNIDGKAMVVWFCLRLDFESSQYYFHPSRMGTIIR